ncbi:recombinase family protein [Candidatus Saccharibacteria bacterium]|nr:recombinase family protein [Candidatus Saccharibacteria bacterium]
MAGSEKKTRVRTKTVRTPLTKEQLLKSEQVVLDSLKDNPDIFDLPESKHNANELTDYFLKITEGSQRILPKERRRYAIYLRKSTDTEDRQVRSLDDQKAECLLLARQLNIVVRQEDIFIESASAKTSGNRPIFDGLLNGFKTKKYHGLLAWSPDRLSRNMKEAGEIIEMIDLEQIQDLHFKTYQFDNTPNGKMLLGILFATSKQYSDKLGVDVSRGITGAIRDGKYVGLAKKGYYADPTTGYFIPDGHNWQLLRQAVVLRLQHGKTNQEVADFLNDAHFSYRNFKDDEPTVAKMDKKAMSIIFKDPFYCGVYKYGERVANLNDIYDFLPLITADEFISLTQNVAYSFNEKFVGRKTASKRLDFGLLREKVICDYCDKIMIFQRTKVVRGKNAGSWLLSFYCRNEDCIRKDDAKAIEKYGKKLPKGVRMKYISSYIEWTLRNLTQNVLEAHKVYVGRLEQKIAVDKQIAKRKLSDAETELNRSRDEYSKYQNFQVSNPDAYKQHHKGKLEEYQNLINVHTASRENLKAELARLNDALPTREQFVELVHSYLETLLNTTDLIEEDAVYQEVVLNLRVGDNAVSVIKLNPPYDMMVDLDKNFSWSG